MISLARGFTAGAGASSLIGTLWLVNEKSTEILVERFYHYWLSDNLSKAEALHLAQLDVLNGRFGSEEFSDAKYWAAFTLYGDR